MLKVVIDTNLIISSLWGGKPKELINLWQNGKIEVLTSQVIIKEYLEVLARFDLTPDDLKEWAWSFSIKTTLVEPKEKINLVKADPDDNKFIECAAAGAADFILAGDKHLINIHNYKGVKIVLVADFLASCFPS